MTVWQKLMIVFLISVTKLYQLWTGNIIWSIVCCFFSPQNINTSWYSYTSWCVCFFIFACAIWLGQTFNLFNSVYQSISGRLNHKKDKNTCSKPVERTNNKKRRRKKNQNATAKPSQFVGGKAIVAQNTQDTNNKSEISWKTKSNFIEAIILQFHLVNAIVMENRQKKIISYHTEHRNGETKKN